MAVWIVRFRRGSSNGRGGYSNDNCINIDVGVNNNSNNNNAIASFSRLPFKEDAYGVGLSTNPNYDPPDLVGRYE